MNRRILIGAVLLVLGVGFGVTGYERMQPTVGDRATEFLANLSGQRVPAGLQRDKTDAYILLAAGVGLFVTGIGVLARHPK